MENESTAILLKEDPNKSLRFLYLALLMSKKNNHYMQNLINKIYLIKTNKQEIKFIGLDPNLASLMPTNISTLET